MIRVGRRSKNLRKKSMVPYPSRFKDGGGDSDGCCAAVVVLFSVIVTLLVLRGWG